MEFTPEQKVINDLFGNDLIYKIPTYQRPYSWDSKGKSNKDNQVNIMWDDLTEHFETDGQNIYFMGSMVLIGNSATRTFEVVDGQQRLITLTLLFVAIKCMLERLDDDELETAYINQLTEFRQNAQDSINSLLFNRKLFGVMTVEKKVKIESSAGFDYDQILKKAIECRENGDIQDANEEQQKVSQRYFSNRDYFISKLKEKFLSDGTLNYNNAERLNEFIDFLKNKVTVVRILSPRFEVAYQIFEILNNRGLPLSNKDLFRNFLISEMHNSGITDPNQKWLALDEYELTPEFISRYVESKTARKQKHSAFNGIRELYETDFNQGEIGKSKVELFYEDVEKNLTHYTNIELLSFENKQIKHRVQFLKNSGNARYVINVLLALFNQIQDENQIIRFLSELEVCLLYLLLGPSKRFQSKITFDAIQSLNNNNFDTALQTITLSPQEKTHLTQIILNADFKDNEWAKLLISRYVWGKDMEAPKDVVALDLHYKTATLEHIIPQKPDNNTNWATDFSSDFRRENTYKLGNMTLLTQRMNAKAKNYDFSRKKEVYQKMKLSITTEIGALTEIDERFIENRNQTITQYLVNHLSLSL